MKKFIFIIVAVLGLGFSVQAQNANRSGAFIEFSGGLIVGKSPLLDVDESTNVIGNECVTTIVYDYLSGLTLQLSGGYRWAFARHWALDGKVGFSFPIEELDDFCTLEIGPALRYTSNELGNSNVSIYFALNPNVIYHFREELLSFGYEIQTGVNITPKFSVGLIWNANLTKYHDGLYYSIGGVNYYSDHHHTGSIGINLGYRF